MTLNIILTKFFYIKYVIWIRGLYIFKKICPIGQEKMIIQFDKFGNTIFVCPNGHGYYNSREEFIEIQIMAIEKNIN